MRKLVFSAIFMVSTVAAAATMVPSVQCSLKENASNKSTAGISNHEVQTYLTVMPSATSTSIVSRDFKSIEDANQGFSYQCRVNVEKYGKNINQTFGLFSRTDDASTGKILVEFMSGHLDQNCKAVFDAHDDFWLLPLGSSPFSTMAWDSQAVCVRSR